MTVVLAELPGVSTVEQIEALLPWALSVDEVSRRYAEQPAPPSGRAEKKTNASP